MSYAEYGSRIFLRGANTKPLEGDGFGHRLKMIESCSDIRAWSLDPIENFRYFRETTEQGNTGAIMVSDPVANDMTDDPKVEKIKNLKRELAKYKTLLTEEQKKKLEQTMNIEKDSDDAFMKGDGNIIDRIFQQLYKLAGYKEAGFKKSATLTEIKDDGINKLRSDVIADIQHNRRVTTNKRNKKRISKIEIKSSTDISFSISRDTSHNDSRKCKSDTEWEEEKRDADNAKYNLKKKSSASSLSNCINYEDNDNSNEDNNSNGESRLSNILSESERSHIIKTESMIIALEHTICAKDAELEELSHLNNKLELCLKNRDVECNQLKDQLQQHHNYFQDTLTQRNKELSELKNEVLNGKNIIDQLRKSLEEKRNECDNQSQKLDSLKHDFIDTVSLKNERDSLATTCGEVSNLLMNAGCFDENLANGLKRLIRERNDLLEMKKNLALNCMDKEDEIDKLIKLINQMQKEDENRKLEMMKMEEELQKKTKMMETYAEEVRSLTKQCREKLAIERSLQEYDITDGDCDQAFAKYFTQSVKKIHELTEALKDAGDDVGKRKDEIKKLKKQMDENIQAFKEQLDKKSKEGKFYRFQYEECQKTIDRQINEIENLRKVFDKLEKRLIYKMELSISELHQEHSNLTAEIQNLTSCIHQRDLRIVDLENDRENLLNKIDETCAQLDEKNLKIEALKEENSRIMEKFDESKKNIEDIFNALESLKFQIEKVYQASLIDKKFALQDKDKRILERSIINLNNDYDTYQNTNKTLVDSVTNMLNQAERLETKISSVKDGMNHISSGLKVNICLNESLTNLTNSGINKQSNDFDNLNNEQILNEQNGSRKIETESSTEKHSELNDVNQIFFQTMKNKTLSLKQMIEAYRENRKSTRRLETLDDERSISDPSSFNLKTSSSEQTSENTGSGSLMQLNDTNSESAVNKEPKYLETLNAKQFILRCSERLSNKKFG